MLLVAALLRGDSSLDEWRTMCICAAFEIRTDCSMPKKDQSGLPGL